MLDFNSGNSSQLATVYHEPCYIDIIKQGEWLEDTNIDAFNLIKIRSY